MLVKKVRSLHFSALHLAGPFRNLKGVGRFLMVLQKHISYPIRHFIARGFFFIGLGVFVSHPLSAQLTWSDTQIDQTLNLGQDSADAVFKFTNSGIYPVTIRSTSSSCGCTTAELGQRVYEPGEQGEIKTRFEVGGRTGQRRNVVQVQTDDPAHPSVSLAFVVDIPTLVTITPRLVQWRVGAPQETQSVFVQMNPDANVEITGVKVDDTNFKAVLVQGDTPHDYRLELTPLQINSPARAVFALQTEPKVKNEDNFTFYAFVR